MAGNETARRAQAGDLHPDAVEVDSRVPPPLTRVTLYVLLAFIAIAIVWATLSTVDIIVTAQGRLITTAQSVVVQALETSVVRSLDVRVGQSVHKGDRLVTLDPVFAEADVAQTKQRFESLEAEVDRLEAELNGKPYRANSHQKDSAVQAEMYEKRAGGNQALARGAGGAPDRPQEDRKDEGGPAGEEVLLRDGAARGAGEAPGGRNCLRGPVEPRQAARRADGQGARRMGRFRQDVAAEDAGRYGAGAPRARHAQGAAQQGRAPWSIGLSDGAPRLGRAGNQQAHGGLGRQGGRSHTDPGPARCGFGSRVADTVGGHRVRTRERSRQAEDRRISVSEARRHRGTLDRGRW